MPPTSTASHEPEGPVFRAYQQAVERFASSVHRAVFLVEARRGNLLSREPLLELWHNTQRLRAAQSIGAKLVATSDPRTGGSVDGLASVADAVDGLLRAQGVQGLQAATPVQIDQALQALLEQRSPESLGLSAHTVRQADGRWKSPAAVLYVFADNAALGGGASSAMIGSDAEAKERFGREVLSLLRGAERHYQAWGIAIDVNLTSEEQGRAAGPFIGWTILAVLLLVGLAFRSYWAVSLCGLALGALMIWLRGLSNLFGLGSSQILSTIVPIAMISFGIDFALHAVGRYREHRREKLKPRRALFVGFTGVLAALVLAAASDGAAFLANTTTGIESLVQFGLAAAMAQISALVILGVAVPLALMRIEQRIGSRQASRATAVVGGVMALVAALAAMVAVLLLVFVEPWQGLVVLTLHLVVFVAAPALLLGRGRAGAATAPAVTSAAGAGLPWLGTLVVGLARRRWLVLPTVLAATVVCGHFALQVTPRFDVKDFFAPDCDFVVGLDKLDLHLGTRGGEPATIFVEAELTQPQALLALRRFRDRLAALPTDRLARNERGRVQVDAGLLPLVDAALSSPEVKSWVHSVSGVGLVDVDADGVPDSPTQLAALYDVARERGLPAIGGTPARSPAAVAQVLWQSDDRSRQATRLTVRLPGSRAQENLALARAELEPLVAQLRTELVQIDSKAQAMVTGPPIVRQAALEAILRAFKRSLPVALVLCFLVAAAFMRSLRHALVSTAPIVLVVAWLYAAMYALDIGLSVVSATIGAVSIGIGIDFAVHFTMRYREERRRHASTDEALRNAGRGTGAALLISAASSIVGFAILAFAPMPMFASYGLLTAMMVAMAAAATLLVLPSLLVIVERRT